MNMGSRSRHFERKAAIVAVFTAMLSGVPSAGQTGCRKPDESLASTHVAVRDCLRAADRPEAGKIVEGNPEAGRGLVPGGDGAFSGVPATTDALLEEMSLSAGVIFAGEVVAVRGPGEVPGSRLAGAAGVVEIDLRVERALRGPAVGSIYTLREWAGLWAGAEGGQARRYRAGQRLLLFLYPPGRDGLSAPVRGAEGAIPLHGSGAAPGPDEEAAASAEWLVDLRWLKARVLRRPEFVPSRKGLPLAPQSAGEFEAGGDGSEQTEVVSAPSSEPMLHYASANAEHRRKASQETQVTMEAQPLSQVLALCHAAITLDAKRRRDAGL